MKGLLIKDFYVITKQLKIFIIAIPIMSLTGDVLLSTLAIVLGATMPMTAIAYDERSKWGELANMMPYSRTDLVLSKYVLGYLCIFSAFLLSLLGQFIGFYIFKGNGGSSFGSLIFSVIGGLIFLAINNFVTFKFGSEKSRYFYIVTMGIICALGTLFANPNIAALNFISSISPVFVFLGAILLNLVSVYFSIKVKQKQWG